MTTHIVNGWLGSVDGVELPEAGTLTLSPAELEAVCLAANFIEHNALVGSIAINITDYTIETPDSSWKIGCGSVVVSRYGNFFEVVEEYSNVKYTCALPDKLV